MMELSQTALFIGSIINLYALVLILRAWLQFARVDYYNPVSTFVVKMTDPVLKPLRKIAPTIKNIAVLSWFNRGNSPVIYAFYQLSEPLLKPIRRFLPTLGMIDFSPMVVVFILLFLNNLMLDMLGGLWMIAG